MVFCARTCEEHEAKNGGTGSWPYNIDKEESGARGSAKGVLIILKVGYVSCFLVRSERIEGFAL